MVARRRLRLAAERYTGLSPITQKPCPRVAAEGDRRITRRVVHLLDVRSGGAGALDRRVKVLNAEFDMDGCPVPTIPAEVVTTPRRRGSGRLLQEAESEVVRRHRRVARARPEWLF